MKEDRYVRSLANYLCSPVCAVFIYVECELLSGFQGKGREGKGREGEGEGGEENGERRRGGSHICHPFFVWSEYLFNFIEK